MSTLSLCIFNACPPSSLAVTTISGWLWLPKFYPIPFCGVRSGKRRIVSSLAHSNAKILKTNRRTRFGQALSSYDSEEEEDDEDDDEEEEDEKEEDDSEGVGWSSDEEFAEPAEPDPIQRKSKLLAAAKMKQGSNKPQKGGGGLESGGSEKMDGIKPARNKYSQLSEEIELDRRWIPLLDYLTTFGLSELHLLQMYARHMPFFQINVISARERLEYLLSVGVKHNDIKKMLLRQPQILEYTVKNNLKVHVAFLVSLGIPDSRIGRIVAAAPSFLSYSVENSLRPTVRYLIEEVGIQEKDLSKVIQLSPQILVQRVDISWTDRYNFLKKELGAPRDSIVKMVTKHPQLLHYSIEDGLLPRINFLRSIGMCNSDILKVLTSLTQVLSLSLEGNLRPKYTYLVNELRNEVKVLTKYPMYLSLSLDQRIRPRHRFLVFLKKAPKGPFPLSSLVPTDESFCQQWAKTSKCKDYRISSLSQEITHQDTSGHTKATSCLPGMIISGGTVGEDIKPMPCFQFKSSLMLLHDMLSPQESRCLTSSRNWRNKNPFN
ncbi:hypothetical protein V2J09_018298 [Rumex salicifolius]